MKKLLKSGTNAALELLGYEIIPIWRREKLPMARHLRSLFSSLDINCVVDVGANIGQYRDFIRDHVGYDGQIISFEPIKEHTDLLKAKAAGDDKWDVYNLALGNENTELDLNIMKQDQFSSFLAPKNTVVTEYAEMNSVIEVQRTQVCRLDTWATEYGAKYDMRRIYLKLDTQGFDLRVLEGSSGLLSNILALQSEISCLQIYDGSPKFAESIKSFEDSGFDISDMYVVNYDRFHRAVEFDCVMLNRGSAVG